MGREILEGLGRMGFEILVGFKVWGFRMGLEILVGLRV